MIFSQIKNFILHKKLKMDKKRILLLISILSILIALIYCWAELLKQGYLPQSKHYIAAGLFIVVLINFFLSYKLSLLITGIYTILAMLAIINLSPLLITFNWSPFGKRLLTISPIGAQLFLVYFIFNITSIINLYLDYKQKKQ